jgi:hypothetical protein
MNDPPINAASGDRNSELDKQFDVMMKSLLIDSNENTDQN